MKDSELTIENGCTIICNRRTIIQKGMQKMDANERTKAIVDTPNFFRLARELSRFKNPYKAADTILLFAKNSVEDSAHSE